MSDIRETGIWDLYEGHEKSDFKNFYKGWVETFFQFIEYFFKGVTAFFLYKTFFFFFGTGPRGQVRIHHDLCEEKDDQGHESIKDEAENKIEGVEDKGNGNIVGVDRRVLIDDFALNRREAADTGETQDHDQKEESGYFRKERIVAGITSAISFNPSVKCEITSDQNDDDDKQSRRDQDLDRERPVTLAGVDPTLHHRFQCEFVLVFVIIGDEPAADEGHDQAYDDPEKDKNKHG